jgi:exonuclease VII small subunit
MTQQNHTHRRQQNDPDWVFYDPQQNVRYQNNRQQGNQSRKYALEAQLRRLESEMVRIDARIDAAYQKGIALEAAKNQHLASASLAIAQVALSTLGVRYLPPVARTWYYKNQEYDRAQEALRLHCIDLNAQREALAIEIEHIQTQLEMLQFYP